MLDLKNYLILRSAKRVSKDHQDEVPESRSTETYAAAALAAVSGLA